MPVLGANASQAPSLQAGSQAGRQRAIGLQLRRRHRRRQDLPQGRSLPEGAGDRSEPGTSLKSTFRSHATKHPAGSERSSSSCSRPFAILEQNPFHGSLIPHTSSADDQAIAQPSTARPTPFGDGSTADVQPVASHPEGDPPATGDQGRLVSRQEYDALVERVAALEQMITDVTSTPGGGRTMGQSSAARQEEDVLRMRAALAEMPTRTT